MQRIRRCAALLVAVGAIAALALSALSVGLASAKGPCGKKSSCERLIQRVKVHAKATEAKLQAVLNGRVEYKFWLKTPHEELLVASGHTPGTAEQETVGVEIHELAPSTSYVFWVEATAPERHEGCSECAHDNRKFKTKP